MKTDVQISETKISSQASKGSAGGERTLEKFSFGSTTTAPV